MTVEVQPPRDYDMSCSSCNTLKVDVVLSIGSETSRQRIRLCTDCLDQLGWELIEKTTEPHPEHPTSSPPIDPPLHQQR